MQGIRLPFQAVLNKTIETIRRESHASDAVVILIDDKTGECKIKTMRGDARRLHHLLTVTLQSVERQKMGAPSSIIMPN